MRRGLAIPETAGMLRQNLRLPAAVDGGREGERDGNAGEGAATEHGLPRRDAGLNSADRPEKVMDSRDRLVGAAGTLHCVRATSGGDEAAGAADYAELACRPPPTGRRAAFLLLLSASDFDFETGGRRQRKPTASGGAC